jgi:hypothetical protein
MGADTSHLSPSFCCVLRRDRITCLAILPLLKIINSELCLAIVEVSC